MWTHYSSCFDCEYQPQYSEFAKEQHLLADEQYGNHQYIDYSHHHCHHQQTSNDECCGNGFNQMAVVPDNPIPPINLNENSCAHVRDGNAQCKECLVTGENGGQSIAIDDLVDIVMQTTENINGNYKMKKRELNRDAAARYRMKQKERWSDLQQQKGQLEEKNSYLKRKLEELEEEVSIMKKKILTSK